MAFEHDVKRALDALTERVRDEMGRQLSTVVADLSASADAERATVAERAAEVARETAERGFAERMATATQAAEEQAEARGREAGRQEGLAQGRKDGFEDGRAKGLQDGRAQGREEGVEEGRRDGLAQGRKDGFEDGRAKGLQDGRAQGREEGVEEGRRDGLAQGRKEGFEEGRAQGLRDGRAEGREEGVEEGRKQGLAQGLEQGLERGREEGRDEGLRQGRAEGIREGREEGLESGRTQGRDDGRREGVELARKEARDEFRANERAAGERLVDGIRAIDRANSLSEILDTLVSCAGREAARVGILLVVSGEQLRGWRFIGFGSPMDEYPTMDVARSHAGIVDDAIRSGTSASSHTTPDAVAPIFAELAPGSDMLAVPVTLSGQVVAVLYADLGPDNPETAGGRGSAAWLFTLETLARHAARCLEAITATRAVQGIRDGAQAASADEESARRYAKLLVSEIKLYYEPEIVAGRRDRDLGTRLGGEIARARALYEQRVPSAARRGADHFQAELVSMLAEGDASLLEV